MRKALGFTGNVTLIAEQTLPQAVAASINDAVHTAVDVMQHV